ncbi:MAG: hypothetical protein IT379_04515 [Deltaproteobacteria bacterium]|nr:hypothetical protein [Deltaproteobacteria bacterium]
MSLLKYIVQGFGWKVGGEIAGEAIKKAHDDLTKESPEETEARQARQRAEDERRRAEEARKQREQEKRDAIKREREIDQELAALKKRVAKKK